MRKFQYLTVICLLGAFSILFFSCKKEKQQNKTPIFQSDNASTDNSSAKAIEDFSLPEDATEEMTRIYNDISNAEYVIGVTSNPQFGTYCSSCSSDTYLNGFTEPSDDISITINDQSFAPMSDGQWMLPSINWAELYNSDVNVEIKSGSTVLKSVTMHVPKNYLATQLSSTKIISRTGNTLSWTPDINNSLGYVILHYNLFDANDNLIEEDGELMEDDGSFSIDDIISNPDVTSIYFTLVSGNTTSTIINGEKLLFAIESYDHHKYRIQ